jgi:hypothetical protein
VTAQTGPTVPADPAVADLEGRAVPPPSGYSASTQSPSHGETPAQFEQDAGQTGASAAMGFLGGYSASYDSVTSNESIQLVLSEFASADGALTFDSLAPSVNGEAPSLSPITSKLSTISGSEVLIGTKADSQGFYTAELIFQKTIYVCVLEYFNNSPISSLPPVLAEAAAQQYSRL